MLPPFAAAEIVVIVGVVDGNEIWLDEPTALPAKLKKAGPFPSAPSVTMYETVITESLSNFLPKIPSPKSNSYLSSVISWIKYISDMSVMFNILSTLRYSLPKPVSAEPFTYTLMVEVSINEFSSINRWSSDPSTLKVLVN